MLFDIFKLIFTKLIGRIPEDKQAAAWTKFEELLAILAESGAKGAVEGMHDK